MTMRKFIANLMVGLVAASAVAAPADFFTTNRLGVGDAMTTSTFGMVRSGSDTFVLHATNTPGRGVGMTVLAAPTETATLSFGDTVASNRYSFQGDMAVPEFVLRSGTDRVFTVHSDGTLTINAGVSSNDAVTVTQVNATNAVQDARVTTIATSNDAQQTVLGALQTSNGLHATAISTLQTSNGLHSTAISTLQTSNTTHAAATAGLSATNAAQNTAISTLQSSNDTQQTTLGTLQTSNGLQQTTIGTLQTSNALAGVASNWSYHVARSNVVLNGKWLSGDGGNEGVAVRADGNVGIGTTNPVATLTVNGSFEAANSAVLRHTGEQPFLEGTDLGTISFVAADHNGNDTAGVVFRALSAEDWGPPFGYYGTTFTLGTILTGSTEASERLRVSGAGNVGIGTTNPATTLDVNGPATIRQALTITNTTVHGNMTFTNAGTYFEDLSFSANNIKLSGATDIVADPVYGTLDFDTDCTTNVASSDYAWFVAQMPHKKKLGSAIAPHLHFMQTNADQTNMWWAQYKWMDIGETNAPFTTLGFATNVVAYASTIHQLAAFPSIPGSDTNLSSILVFRLCRNGANGTGNAKLFASDLHIECDSLGSDAEYVK